MINLNSRKPEIGFDEFQGGGNPKNLIIILRFGFCKSNTVNK